MAHYIKFMQGSEEAFKKLDQKEEDTLYYIHSGNFEKGSFYLGEQKIITEQEIQKLSLKNIKEILLSKYIKDKSILIYDTEQQAWVNQDIFKIIEVFVGSTKTSSGVRGLVPPPPKGQTNLFLRSDGTWAEGGSKNILFIENESQNTHEEILNSLEVNPGDIVIIEEGQFNIIYLYNGFIWKKINGSQKSENIYFTQDFKLTESIGNIQVPNGKTITLNSKGKNLNEFIELLFCQPKQVRIYYGLIGDEQISEEIIKNLKSANINDKKEILISGQKNKKYSILVFPKNEQEIIKDIILKSFFSISIKNEYNIKQEITIDNQTYNIWIYKPANGMGVDEQHIIKLN